MRCIAAFDSGTQCPAFDGLGQNDGGCTRCFRGCFVSGVDLLVVVPTAWQCAQLIVGKMVDEFAQARIGAEEMLTDVRAAFDGVSLPFAVESCIHFGNEDSVDVFR
ncbi:unannotated protein [freshwater metagenome]|uniref:Unannotated protein n=1 Tax=freshwater metagenome TaxID=449393 RepID=A0A6J6YVC3_9ZZZZ